VRRARFTRKENGIVLSGSSSDLLVRFFGMIVMLGIFLVMFVVVLVVFLMGVRFEFDVITERRDVQGVFMRCVGFRFGNGLRSTHDFFNCRFVSLVFFFIGFVSFGEVLFLFFVFLFEFGFARGTFRGDNFADFILFRVNQAG